jgi:hypothetical protein
MGSVDNCVTTGAIDISQAIPKYVKAEISVESAVNRPEEFQPTFHDSGSLNPTYPATR